MMHISLVNVSVRNVLVCSKECKRGEIMFYKFGLIHNCFIITFILYISIVVKRYIVYGNLQFNIIHGTSGKVFAFIVVAVLMTYIFDILFDYIKKKQQAGMNKDKD